MSKLQIYLAGKIYPNDWRHSIVTDLRNALEQPGDAWTLYKETEWPVGNRAIFGCYDYVGPYFIGCDHGGFHGENSHGYGGPFYDGGQRTGEDAVLNIGCCPLSGIDHYKPHNGSYLFSESRDAYDGEHVEEVRRARIVSLCWQAISRCNFFFAWIEDATAYGTLVELGIAAALGKRIYIAYPKKSWEWDKQIWFAEELAHKVFYHCESASVALADAIEFEVNRRANGLV